MKNEIIKAAQRIRHALNNEKPRNHTNTPQTILTTLKTL